MTGGSEAQAGACMYMGEVVGEGGVGGVLSVENLGQGNRRADA